MKERRLIPRGVRKKKNIGCDVFRWLIVGAMLLIIQKKVCVSGKKFNDSMLYVDKYVPEAFDGMKEIIFFRKKEFFLQRFENITDQKHKAG